MRFVAHAHNNLEAVFARHVKASAIVLGDTLSDSDVIEILSIASSVSAQVLTFLPRFTDASKEEAAMRYASVESAPTQLATGMTTPLDLEFGT